MTNKQAYEGVKANRVEAERAVRAAERIINGHPLKIEAKRRQLRDLD